MLPGYMCPVWEWDCSQCWAISWLEFTVSWDPVLGQHSLSHQIQQFGGIVNVEEKTGMFFSLITCLFYWCLLCIHREVQLCKWNMIFK